MFIPGIRPVDRLEPQPWAAERDCAWPVDCPSTWVWPQFSETPSAVPRLCAQPLVSARLVVCASPEEADHIWLTVSDCPSVCEVPWDSVVPELLECPVVSALDQFEDDPALSLQLDDWPSDQPEEEPSEVAVPSEAPTALDSPTEVPIVRPWPSVNP